MIFGFKARGNLQLPSWSSRLVNYYWFIRVEGRDKSKRVKYYRLIKKEKIRLATLGFHQEDIRLICRYLASFNKSAESRLENQLNELDKQMSFDFFYDVHLT